VIDIRLGKWQQALSTVHDASVRLILTSPPYDNARTYEGTNEPVDFGELAVFALRVLVPGGVMAMVLDGAVNDGVQSVTHLETVVTWSKLQGWRFLQQMAYGRQGSPGAYVGRFRKDAEPIFVFVRDGAKHVCEKDRIATPSKSDMTRASGRSSSRRRDGSKVLFGQDSKGNTREVRNLRHRGSVWDYGIVGHGHDKSADTGHPATFAERFALDAVSVWSNHGDLVCDPFSGSGTVAVACRVLGRSFVGSERVGACPGCGGGFPGACGCPRQWTNYHAKSLHRVDRSHVKLAQFEQSEEPGQEMKQLQLVQV